MTVWDRLRPGARAFERALFEDATSGLLVSGADGVILRANAAARRIGPGLAPGRAAAAIFGEPGRAAAWQAFEPLRRGEVRTFEMDLAFLAAGPEQPGEPSEAETRPYAITAVALPGPGGACGMLLTFTDLGPMRRLQAQLDESRQLQAVGRLTSGLAHDFNNLLTIVAGASGAVLTRVDLDEEAREDAKLIEAAAQRGASLVRQMLQLGRGEAPAPCVVALNDAVRAVVALLRRTLGGAVRLDLELEEPGRAVSIEPAQLDQVLINLLLNARDAMPGGGRILVRTGHVALVRPLDSPGGAIPPGWYALIEVRDEGGGIAPDVLPRIFEPFFTTRPGEGGNGIGLSMVHRIVREAGGFIGVDTNPGEYASFRILLPPLAPLPPAAASAVRGAGGTVLLVDDEEPLRRLAARILRQAGWTVLESESGDDAAARDPRELAAIDAVVSDVSMPGALDGPALIARLRLGRPGLPAVLISGYLGGAAVAPGVRLLSKPYASSELLDVLASAVAAAAGPVLSGHGHGPGPGPGRASGPGGKGL